jgi:hypothetical protein
VFITARNLKSGVNSLSLRTRRLALKPLEHFDQSQVYQFVRVQTGNFYHIIRGKEKKLRAMIRQLNKETRLDKIWTIITNLRGVFQACSRAP